jgi:hypothetical protein
VTGSNSDWVTLYEASSRSTAQFGIFGTEAVRRAVHSRDVPVRALPVNDQMSSIPARIEREISSAMKVEIDHCSYIRDQFGRYLWSNVEIRWRECASYCKANLLPAAERTSTYSRAPKDMINEKIRAEYDQAETEQWKPPNLREIIEPVQEALRAEGFDTSGKHIQELARAEEFKKRRRKPGPTVKSDRHRQGP